MRFIFLMIFLTLFGCAQVPPSSVELSNSISRDIETMNDAHTRFIDFYFDELEKNVNALIDNEYRPYLLQRVIEQDLAAFRSDDPNIKQDSLFNAVQTAFVNNADLSPEQKQTAAENALLGMKFLYLDIDTQVEKRRQSLLAPLKKQRQAFLAAVQSNYATVMRKNATLTALLASIVEVHETQGDLLEAVDIDRNLRLKISKGLQQFSQTVDQLNNRVTTTRGNIEQVEKEIADAVEAINNFSLAPPAN